MPTYTATGHHASNLFRARLQIDDHPHSPFLIVHPLQEPQTALQAACFPSSLRSFTECRIDATALHPLSNPCNSAARSGGSPEPEVRGRSYKTRNNPSSEAETSDWNSAPRDRSSPEKPAAIAGKLWRKTRCVRSINAGERRASISFDKVYTYWKLKRSVVGLGRFMIDLPHASRVQSFGCPSLSAAFPYRRKFICECC